MIQSACSITQLSIDTEASLMVAVDEECDGRILEPYVNSVDEIVCEKVESEVEEVKETVKVAVVDENVNTCQNE